MSTKNGYFLVTEYAQVTSPVAAMAFFEKLSPQDLANMWLRLQEMKHWLGTEVVVRTAIERIKQKSIKSRTRTTEEVVE